MSRKRPDPARSCRRPTTRTSTSSRPQCRAQEAELHPARLALLKTMNVPSDQCAEVHDLDSNGRAFVARTAHFPGFECSPRPVLPIWDAGCCSGPSDRPSLFSSFCLVLSSPPPPSQKMAENGHCSRAERRRFQDGRAASPEPSRGRNSVGPTICTPSTRPGS